jgi:hypothetical protein
MARDRTYSEQFNEALACGTPAEARAWFITEVKYYMSDHGKSLRDARIAVKSNLGYMAGFANEEAAKKIYELFGAERPLFRRVWL